PSLLRSVQARLVLLPCNSQLPSRHRVHTNAVLSHLVHVHLSSAYLNKKHNRLFAMPEPSLTLALQVLTLFVAITFPFTLLLSFLLMLAHILTIISSDNLRCPNLLILYQFMF